MRKYQKYIGLLIMAHRKNLLNTLDMIDYGKMENFARFYSPIIKRLRWLLN